MKKKNKYITVLDFEIGRVYQYRINARFYCQLGEEYLTNKGHNLGNCEWMVHDISKVITKNRIDV